jgi:predicted heme/steroid binding protein
MRPTLIIYPGERMNADGTTLGRILVTTTGDTYEVAGGPSGKPGNDVGGHTAGQTPSGLFVLGSAEHHNSKNWPSSVVPWGAKIRERDEIVQYELGHAWRAASGPHGDVTAALILFAHRSGRHLNRDVAGRQAREMFYDRAGALMSEWKWNDFGKWSWNLMRDGHRTVYYIHTTPDDEEASDADLTFELQQSHGCLHIRPKDRQKMMDAKLLRAGVVVEIRPYGERLAR